MSSSYVAQVSKQTSLRSLPLPPSTLALFAAAEFETVGDLDGLTAEELAEELNNSAVDASQAARLLLMVRTGGIGLPDEGPSSSSSSAAAASSQRDAPARSALALLEEERRSRRVITFARELDDLLGGGVALKQLTELAGAPGVGKTQVAMQLALNAQIPSAFGGVGGRAAYIDAEGSFLAARALQMAEALVQRLRAVAENDEQRHAAASLDAHAMLDHILVFRVHDHTEQLAAVRAVGELERDEHAAAVAQGGGGAWPSGAGVPVPVKLVVIDSIAFHLRHADVDFKERLQLVGKMGQALSALALRGTDGHGLAAVVINQVTTKVNDAIGSSSLVPALGESWAHVCNVQLMLTWRDGQRVATLYKGRKPGEAVYVVSAEGVRSREAPPLPSPQAQEPPPQDQPHHHQQQQPPRQQQQQQQQQQQEQQQQQQQQQAAAATKPKVKSAAHKAADARAAASKVAA